MRRGAAPRASVVGTAFVNTDGSVGIGLTTVLAPGGAPVHVDARIDVGTLSGTWEDSAGNAGGFVFTPGAGAGGAMRPPPSHDIPAGSITITAIADGAIGATQIGAGAVGATHIAAGAVGGTHIAAGAVSAAHLANGVLGAAQIAPGSIDGTHIAAGAVSAAHLASGVLGAAQIAPGSIDGTHIAAGAVSAAHLANGSVGLFRSPRARLARCTLVPAPWAGRTSIRPRSRPA